MTSLDELLRHEEEEEPGAWQEGRPGLPRRWAWRAIGWLLGSAVLAAALAAGLLVAVRALGYDLWYPLAAAAFFALLALRRVVIRLRVAPVGQLAPLPDAAVEPLAPDRFAVEVQRWQTRLSWSRAGIRPFSRSSPQIAELVDERLRLRHGLTRASDPARARNLVGERAWTYLADPDARTPSPREFAALLTDLEKL